MKFAFEGHFHKRFNANNKMRLDRHASSSEASIHSLLSPASRHYTTRHAIKPILLVQGKVVTCFVALFGQHGATRLSRQARQLRLAWHVFRGVATASTGMDISISLFPEVVPEIDANPEHKRNFYIRTLLLLRRLPCWNRYEATRHARNARHDVWQAEHVTSRHAILIVTLNLLYGGPEW